MDDSLKNKFSPVKDELYRLLVAVYCYDRKFSCLGERLHSETRAFVLEEVTALRLMSNEIILQLCKLDDDDGNWTLRSLKKETFRRSTDNGWIESINAKAKKYRSDINALKVKHRNAYIAHRNADDYPDLFQLPDFQSDFKHLIASALELFESMWCSPVSFGFKLGSMEPLIDFKAELGLSPHAT